ncbi:Protease 2 [compost metagenome]
MHKYPQNFPHAEKKPHTLSIHGDNRTDNYFWLRDRENKDVISYLNAENAYTDEVMAPVQPLEKTIFDEMKSRLKEDDSSVPYKRGEFYYYSRVEAGKQYPIYARKKGLNGAEEVLLNVNEMAKGYSFFDCSGPNMSNNQEWMAYAVDTVGRRFYTIYFKNLKTGELLKNKIENVTGNLEWAEDHKTVFYAQQNPETLRSEKVFRYNIETQKTDLVYFEKDDTFSVGVYGSLSEKFIYMVSGSTLTTEISYLPSNTPNDSFKIFTPREREHEYDVTDDGKTFYIVSNKNAKNFKLMTAEVGKTNIQQWKELIPHRTDVFLQGVLVFKNYIALAERYNGLTRLQITDHKAQNAHVIAFPDQSYVASVGANAEFDTDTFRYVYESLRLPQTTYDFNMKTHGQELKKTKEVPHYNAELYKTERIFVTARDGAKVPVSLIMKKDHKLDGTAGVLVYGYGSYGANMEPWFNSNVFSLVDRGFVYAMAHIRGGSEMGREWFENGRTVNKKNTFTDFIDTTEYLVNNKYASPRRVYAMGGSAGGLLMGAIMNMRPDLYTGIVAQVPFVDVITTMLDETIPLTTSEYDQWGNPNEKAAYDYIKSYSPYDNVEKKAYPNTLVTTGLHDSQVQYWEPAKWVAKLREYKTNDAVILLKTNMDAGHGGATGRFDRLKERATDYAFILMIDQNR